MSIGLRDHWESTLSEFVHRALSSHARERYTHFSIGYTDKVDSTVTAWDHSAGPSRWLDQFRVDIKQYCNCPNFSYAGSTRKMRRRILWVLQRCHTDTDVPIRRVVDHLLYGQITVTRLLD